MPGIVKFVETEGELEGTRPGAGVFLFNGHTVSAGDDEKVLAVVNGGVCTALWTYLIPLNCTIMRAIVVFKNLPLGIC